MDFAEAKAIHDLLVKNRPDGVEHSQGSCEFCTDPDTSAATTLKGSVNREEEKSMDAIYTQEQADALVEAAVSKANVAAESASVEALEAVRKELEDAKAEIAKLQADRDADQIALTAAKDEAASLQAEITKRDEEAVRLTRRDERVAQVKDAAKFSEEYIEANADRWSRMDDEQFASLLADYRDVAAHVAPAATEETTEVPEETAMNNERVEKPRTSARSALFQYTLKGGSN